MKNLKVAIYCALEMHKSCPGKTVGNIYESPKPCLCPCHLGPITEEEIRAMREAKV